MVKYVFKRIGLMLLTFLIIMLICFVLIKLLEPPVELDYIKEQNEKEIRIAMGYDKPIMIQFFIYVRNIITKWDWGYSFEIKYCEPVFSILKSKLTPTIMINVLSLLFAIPAGLILGIVAALKKNKWQDNLISTFVMLFVSVPSFVYAFLVQYFLSFKLGLFPLEIYSVEEAGGTYFSFKMIYSMALPILSLSFGVIAGLTRFTRAELTEVLTNESMLLARTKGLTRRQATIRHALRNAMVPILPMIIGEFIGILSGSLIIEKIFNVPGVGGLYIQAINTLDYNVFMGVGMFYTFVSLTSGILIDISYGFIDPRIRMGANK